MKKQIDIVIAGAQKCATTSLHQMLAQHPKISTHGTGQWPYFLHETDYSKQYEGFMSEFFGNVEDDQLLLARDTSLSASSVALKRMAELSPTTKLIVMVRNPIDRAYSAYTFAKSKQYDVEPTFEDGIVETERFSDDINRYLVRNYVPLGFYHQTMKRIEEHFPKEQCLILKSEDLKADPEMVLDQIFDFLDLEKRTIAPIVTNRTRKSRGGFVQRLTKTDNVFRSIGRRILPLGLRVFILRSIGKATTSKVAFEPMTLETRKKLEALFADDLSKLKADYGIDYLESKNA